MDELRDINDNGVDVEALMKRVKEKMDKITPVQLSPAEVADDGIPGQLRSDIEYLRNVSSIDNSQYIISSHRKLVGPVLVKGRQLVNGEVRRYVDPMASQQSEFNTSAVRAIEDLLIEMNVRSRSVDSRIEEGRMAIRANDARTRSDVERVRSEVADLRDKKLDPALSRLGEDIGGLQSDVAELRDKTIYQTVDKKMEATLSWLSADIENKAWLAAVLEKRIGDNAIKTEAGPGGRDGPGMDYLDFENRFRGHVQDIKQRQSYFVEHFRQCTSVLDIGCGRGEFLELMRENGIPARGIDLDDGMVSYCTRLGLDVRKADALAFLEEEEDGAVDGVFMDQVIEHLDPPYLVKLLMLCHRKLKPGGIILMETVNPTSLTSFANFYIDLTHVKPVHPYTLRYLAESAGFRDIEVQFIAPVQDELRLKKIDIGSVAGEGEKAAFATYNANIDRLNDVLFGAQDYALVGRK